MPTYVIDEKFKLAAPDLAIVDPDRTPHFHPHPDHVVAALGLSPDFARGDLLNVKEDLPNTSPEHLKTLIKDGALIPLARPEKK